MVGGNFAVLEWKLQQYFYVTADLPVYGQRRNQLELDLIYQMWLGWLKIISMWWGENPVLRHVMIQKVGRRALLVYYKGSFSSCAHLVEVLILSPQYHQNSNSLFGIFFFSDASTAWSLELVENMKNPRSRHSLYGILNFTKTPGGARFLRANILQPPCGNLDYRSVL